MQGGKSDKGIMDSTNTIMHVFEENKIDLTNITGERGLSSGENAIMQEAESDINGVDSAKKEQREGGVTMAREEGWEQSQGVAREGLTPYVFLTLEELQNLRKTIKKSLGEQSSGVAEEGLTPYGSLTLEELKNLRKTIKKNLRELDDQDRE